MKVLLVNGSPHKHGCTERALQEVAAALERSGVESDIFWIGNKPIIGCTACGKCNGSNGCAFDDSVNEFIEAAAQADGFVFGSPVHYAAASGAMTSFMDRVFYASGSLMVGKPAAAVCSARRAGTTSTFDQLNKYFTIKGMPVVSSSYWNMVHGSKPEDVEQDLEGLQTMRGIGNNMAWLLKCIEAGKAAGIDFPAAEPPVKTNFIR